MGDYERSTTVSVAPARLFDYLADLTHLPSYLPRLTSVTPQGGDKYQVSAHIDPPDGPARDVEGEAWMKVKEAGRTLSWGSTGPNHYRGELDVDPGDDDGSSKLTVRIHTERVEGDSIDSGLEETLAGLRRAVEGNESS